MEFSERTDRVSELREKRGHKVCELYRFPVWASEDGELVPPAILIIEANAWELFAKRILDLTDDTEVSTLADFLSIVYIR